MAHSGEDFVSAFLSWRQHRFTDGDVYVPPQDQTCEVYHWNAIDTALSSCHCRGIPVHAGFWGDVTKSALSKRTRGVFDWRS